jgi:acyl-coenzyme A synthetase/AMP-(fatty) acid ligase
VIHTQRVAGDPHSFAQGVLHATAADRLYATSKLFFAYALANSLFAGLRMGATIILDRERPTPERVRAMVAPSPHRPLTVPTLYLKMLQEQVRRARAGGSTSCQRARRCRRGYAVRGQPPGRRRSGYGTSETLSRALWRRRVRLLRPTPLTSVRYAEAIDAAAPQRIWVRNPTLATGYWRRPSAAGARGWFRATCSCRGDERLEFAGRSDDC